MHTMMLSRTKKDAQVRADADVTTLSRYDIADRIGLMVMPGWECCDKWEAW